jgi:hypothetical protein
MEIAVVPSNNKPSKAESYSNQPVYELRLLVDDRSDWGLEIWQLPSPSTPRLTSSEHVATLKGAALRIIESRLLKRLSRANILLGTLKPRKRRSWSLDEELSLTLGLLFRTLAPMRNLDRIRQVADGIDDMSREEAGYWLGMAMHRKCPRRVLAALRTLLTMP